MFLMKRKIDFYIVIFFQYISNKKGKKKKTHARKYAHNYSSLNDFGEEVNLI